MHNNIRKASRLYAFTSTRNLALGAVQRATERFVALLWTAKDPEKVSRLRNLHAIDSPHFRHRINSC